MRRSGLGVVLALVVVLAAASQAYASEISVGDWWDTTYSGTYGAFENAWAWVPYDIWSDGTSLHTMQVEMAGYASVNTYGWFDLSTDPTDYNPGGVGNGYHEIMAGSDAAGTTKTVNIPLGAVFDFYLRSGDGDTWHSFEPLESNSDTYNDHQWLFVSTNAAWTALHGSINNPVSYLQAWEDKPSAATYDPTEKHWVKQGTNWVYDENQTGVALWYTNGEPDNNDMVLTFWTDKDLGGHPYPEPGSLGLLAMALCSAVVAGRKRWSR